MKVLARSPMQQRHAIVRAFRRTAGRWLHAHLSVALLICLLPLAPNALAQTPQAILVDGPGPWQDELWKFTAAEFAALLQEAGYSVTTVAPPDVPAALVASRGSLLAVPSLESLPFQTVSFLGSLFTNTSLRNSLMASGREPFRNPLYRTPDGQWLNAADYQAAVGSPPPQVLRMPPFLATISPSSRQYVSAAGRRLPIVTQRGLYGFSLGRTRIIGDVLNPSATVYSYLAQGFSNFPAQINLTVWLPSPRLPEPHRTELVAALRNGIGPHLQVAGPQAPVWLPGETIPAQATVANLSESPAAVTLQWSITGGSGAEPQPPIEISVGGLQEATVPLTLPSLPQGEYALRFRLTSGGQELDRLETFLRVLDPQTTRQPNQKIEVRDGAFYVNGREVFLHGVNYWPRYAGVTLGWLSPAAYDPERIEADLALMESLHFNLLNIRYADPSITGQSRTLMDFLERCRNHNLWVRIELPATVGNNAFAGTLNPDLGKFLTSAFLPGNDRVFAYELLWEPYLGMQKSGGYGGYLNGQPVLQGTGRVALDGEWRTWVDDQYGSLTAAQQAWGIEPPRDQSGQLTNPTDAQYTSDGPWRIMVAAYRRFLDDYLGRNLGLLARELRRTDPDALIAYRHWSAMSAFGNENTNYDVGTGAAHIDFLSLESYEINQWPELRKMGFATAYSRYRSGGKPVQWVEYGYNMGPSPNAAAFAAQTRYCQDFMRLVEDDGSNGNTIWWWPGGVSARDNADFGIVHPDGSPRGCALALAEARDRFAQSPPRIGPGPSTTIQIDRDADARGQHGLFLRWADEYVARRASGEPVRLTSAGSGTTTATMPALQVGNVPYSGTGPLKYANAEFGGLRILCPGIDATVENGATIQVPPSATCRIGAIAVNTGEAEWLPSGAAAGSVSLHTSAADAMLPSPLAPLQRTQLPDLLVTVSQSPLVITGGMRIAGTGDFGETLRLTLAVQGTSGTCAATLNPAGSLTIPPAGATAAIAITAAADCSWTATSPQPWVTFDPPSGTGNGQAVYTVQENIGPARQVTVTVAGFPLTILQAGSVPSFGPPPSVGPRDLNFGTQSIGTPSAAQTVSITNGGSSPIPGVFTGLGGPNLSDFALSNTCGEALPAGASCSISVVFTPASAGAKRATLYVNGSTGTASVAVSLTGTGAGTGPKPLIQAIADVWTYTPGIAPGHWVTLGGTTFTSYPQVADLGASDLLPTRLGEVSVTFNGAPAVLSYAGPSQINALVPATVQPGPVTVIVESEGVASDPFPVEATQTRPTVYALPNTGATAFSVTAALQGTAFLVGNPSIDPRVTRPVFGGDILDLYMIGLGATQDPAAFVTGRQFAGAFPIRAPISARIGGLPAPVIFAGLTTPGLYLVRVQVPDDVALGNQPLELTVGDPPNQSKTPAFLTLTMGAPASRITTALAPAPRSTRATVSRPLDPGKLYRLTFDARTDIPRQIVLSASSAVVSATADWQHFVLYFQADETSPPDLDFTLGAQPGTLWIDNVVLDAP